MDVVHSDVSGQIRELHQMLIDSRNGYEEAVKVSQEGDLSGLFRQLVIIRTSAIAEIEQLLAVDGASVDQTQSIMSTINRAVVDIRSMLTGLTATTIPAFVADEEQILLKYDETIGALREPALELAPLLRQRDVLRDKVESMRSMAAAS
ncbi:MAG: DUF2383 domain-containing protein [Hyphomicrobiaceae bacterium]